MTDHFAFFEEPRQAWLDPERLKEKFVTLSATVHPDRVHQLSAAEREAAQQRYTALNTAYQCLKEPRLRLRHLLELESGKKPSDLTQVPEDLMNLFFHIGKAFREVDAFLTEKAGATSPLLKVQLFERGMDWTEQLQMLQQELTGRRERLLAGLRETSSPTTALVENTYRLLSFYDRWLAQVQERIAQLSF
ncbi:MAG: hypothetical protein U1F65_00995 [Verrucomicrobiota bacterium]